MSRGICLNIILTKMVNLSVIRIENISPEIMTGIFQKIRAGNDGREFAITFTETNRMVRRLTGRLGLFYEPQQKPTRFALPIFDFARLTYRIIRLDSIQILVYNQINFIIERKGQYGQHVHN